MTEVSQEVVEGILHAVKVCAALRAKTDAEIADLLEKHVWAHMPMASDHADLVSEAIERLERTNGGPRIPVPAAQGQGEQEPR